MNKRLLFISICLCTVCSLAQAQEKEVFPTRNTEWTVCCNKSVRDFPSLYWSNYHLAEYTISLANRDTVCNQKTYHIFMERDSKGGFRVDASKVWITFDFEHEYQLYDFDANVGDTIFHGTIYKDMPYYEVSYPIENRREFEVISVVDKIENELEEKKLYVSVYVWNTASYVPDWEMMGYDIWQEGLGSLKGLYMSWADMGPELTGGYISYSYYTRSLQHEGEVVYFDSTIPEYPKGPDFWNLNELNTSALQVYYDESSKSLSIRSEDADWMGTFSLYDLSGNRLYRTSVCGMTKIPLELYSGGYYLCEIVCGSRVVYSSKIRL